MTAVPVPSGRARASLCVLGLAWTVPFLQPYHRFPIAAFYNEWLALALGLMAALLLLRAGAWRVTGLPAVAVAALGLVLLLGLQVALGRVNYPEQALVAALYLIWAALLVALGRLLRHELGLTAAADLLAWCLLAGGSLNAIAGLLQLYDAAGPLSFLVADREPPAVYGNLAQRNHFAAYVAMATASAAYLYARGRLALVPAAACLLFFMLALAVSSSRSPWLYLGAFALLALAHHRVARDAAGRRLALCSLGLLPAFALAQWAATLPLLLPVGGVVTSADRLFEPASGIAPRLQLAREAWEVFLAAPWTGAGWGEFAWQHFLQIGARGPGVMPGISNHAHNIVLQLLAETGIAGAALLLAALGVWLAGLRRTRFSLEWWWLIALLAVLGLHSLLEYPLWFAYFLGVAAVLAGLGCRHALPVRREGLARAIAALFILSGAIQLAAAIGPYREFERLVFDPQRRAALDMTDDGFADAIGRVRREPVLAPYVEMAVALGMQVNPERLQEKLDVNGRALRFAPAHAVALHHAALLALAGDAAAATRQLELVLRAYPDKVDDAAAELARLAASHPGELTPLLKLAAARRAALRGSSALEDGARRR